MLASPRLWLCGQMLVAASALVLLPIMPPAHGRMLLLPVAPGATASLPRTVLAHGALLLGAGPMPGSLIVVGDRAALTGPLVRIGALAVATGASGCVETPS